MNKNEKFVITINRELGSGGRTVGRKLSEELVVDYYDKAVIKALQERYRLATEEIEGLKGRSHTVWAEMKRALLGSNNEAVANYYQGSSPVKTYPPTSAEMFETEQEILKSLAEEESCVVAGRSGFYVFRDHPNHLSVLIQASMPFRIERVMRKQNLSEEEARKTIEKVDKMRENYMKKYAKTSRYDTRNYDLVIKADGKTEDEIVDLILRFIG
ncbi:MAG: cytidylate kinase-like family protein [Prevotella sp.]|nr:cytidylate kinase-like family protein [Prevotella sp.]